MTAPLIKVRNLRKQFPLRGGRSALTAVDGVSFSIPSGESLGIVGESGCGKSTLARMLMGLIVPTEGSISFDGADLGVLSRPALRALRRRFQMVFQDPRSSLNPRLSVQRILEEPLRTHGVGRADRGRRVREVLDAVGLPVSALKRHPHEFSGGQRQRIGIARALALKPDFIIADEPVAALDVSIQAQILNLFKDLKQEYGLTCLFISHDLGVVDYVSDRVAVMYLGKIVEWADRDALVREPRHPYTRELLAAAPVPDPERGRPERAVRGDMPNPADPPSGCRFHTRCPLAETRCRKEAPQLVEVHPSHRAACLLVKGRATSLK